MKEQHIVIILYNDKNKTVFVYIVSTVNKLMESFTTIKPVFVDDGILL